MSFVEIFKVAMEALKKLPQNLISLFFADANTSYSHMGFGIRTDAIYLDRKLYISVMRVRHFFRASMYALLLYVIPIILIQWLPDTLQPHTHRLICIVFFSTSVTVGMQILFNYIPCQFENTLMDNHAIKQKTAKKTRTACTFILLLLAVNLFIKTNLKNSPQIQIILFLSLVLWAILFFWQCVPYAFLIYTFKYIQLFKGSINNQMKIVEINNTHLVDFTCQTITETENKALCVFPIPKRLNLHYDETPPPYYVPIKSISYIQAGTACLRYDFEKCKWVATDSR